jgi:two-component system, sensor histidine kinase and response regulator
MSRPDEKILLVDDEPRLLAGLRRRLADRFNILIAESANDAIGVIESEDNIAVVVSDMRMPERDGIDLLAEVGERWPDIRRLMLTGNNDQDTAIEAVNRGRVFRFFRKPCDADELAGALNEAIQEYRFLTGANAEREALELRARAGSRSRKSFLSTISHELLTPLNHIIGYSSMIELKLNEDAECDVLEYVSHIKESGASLLRLVQRVLEIVRFTSGDPGREKEIIEVTAVIEEELNDIRREAAERNINVSFQKPPEPVYAHTNAYELRFALRELFDNAVKFNGPCGQVSVAVSSERNELTIRVADTGIGMTEETIRRALGIFSQGEQSITRRYGGIGLGLTYAAFYARANKGRVVIESEKDKGTAIMLTMPCADTSQQVSKIA